ncbi:phosphoadenosine phosphosulfate reductase family protein [Pseudomonadota bacterium]
MEACNLDCEELKSACQEMACLDLLSYLIKDKFAGKIAITASLRARSIIVQQMISEIDPTVPILYLSAGKQFPESVEYKKMIVERFGFTNVIEPKGVDETKIHEGDTDHIEWVKARYDRTHGATQEAMHLNNTLSEYDAWISAVYHFDQDEAVRTRVEREGKLVRINPLIDWDVERVQNFMEEFELPYHELNKEQIDMNAKHGDGEEVMTFAF